MPDSETVVLAHQRVRVGDGFSWWLVNYNGIVGWTAEGQGAEYWLRPLAQG